MKKSTWGPLYWYTLHCLVIHIQDEHFTNERENIIKMINGIINNLPCPTCKQHAQSMLRTRKLSKIMTKKELINQIYLMHDEVNKRLKKKQVTYDEHMELFEKVNAIKVFKMFIDMNMNDRISINMITSKFHLKLFCETFRKYMMENSQKFVKLTS